MYGSPLGTEGVRMEGALVTQNPDVELLKEHRESRSMVEQLGLRPIGPGLQILLWSLRLYVLFMIAVVVLNTMQTLH